MQVDPWVEKICWSRKWQPTPVFLSGKFYGEKSLAGRGVWQATVHGVANSGTRLSTSLRKGREEGKEKEREMK